MGCNSSTPKDVLLSERKSRRSVNGASLSLFNESSINLECECVEGEEGCSMMGNSIHEGSNLDDEYIEVVDKCIETDDMLLWKDFYQNFDKYKNDLMKNKPSKINSLFTANSNFQRFSLEEDQEKLLREQLLARDFESSDGYKEEYFDKSRSDLTGNNINILNGKNIYDAKEVKMKRLKRGKSKTIQNSPMNNPNRRRKKFSGNARGSGTLTSPNPLKFSNIGGGRESPNKSLVSQKVRTNSNIRSRYSDEDDENLIPVIQNAMDKSKPNQEKNYQKNEKLLSLSGGLNPQQKKFRKLNSKIMEDDNEDELSNDELKAMGIGHQGRNDLIQMKSCDDINEIKKSSLTESESSSGINILENEINLMNNTMVQF